MLTLKESMELAGQNLIDALAPAYDNMPFWSVDIDPELRARCIMACPSHNIGRWWDALLRLEAATGFAIPALAEAAMLGHLEDLFDNPLSVCAFLVSEPEADWKKAAGWVDDHSHREALLGLTCLVRNRGSQWAIEQGMRMIEALEAYILEDGTWDYATMERLARQGGVDVDLVEIGKVNSRDMTATETHGRLIEALLEFFEVAGSEAAMRLAARLAQFHFEHSTCEDGSVPAADYLHTHSLLGTHRGLLLYGQLTRRHEYIERVAKTYRETIRTSVKESGFISHDWGLDTRGETSSPGDAAQLALRLARLGYSEFLDDAERIVRCRILPSQITERLRLKPMEDDGRDEHALLDERALGAYGGMHRHPHGGIVPTTDITAADLHTLCEIYTHAAERTKDGLRINFHFDYEDENVAIASERGQQGQLLIRPKVASPVFIRVPRWTAAESVEMKVNQQAIEPHWIDDFLFVRVREAGAMIQLNYDLPSRTISETTDGVEYRIDWRGDDIVGIAPNTDFLPFYPTATTGTGQTDRL